MTPLPQHGTPAGDTVLAIQKLARRTGGDVQELMTLHVLEAFLARLSQSDFRDDFVLKGGVLLAAFAIRRPTRDIDLQATGITNDVDAVRQRIATIAALDAGDGVKFDPATIAAQAIRDDDNYHGVRVKMVAHLGTARLTIGVDVNFGDPIWPAPGLIDIPRIFPLATAPVQLLGYPLTMVLAEKIVTMIDRGEANTRWRDFADVFRLSGLHRVTAKDLHRSLTAVANYRGSDLTPIAPLLRDMPERAQPKWLAWRRRTRMGLTD